MYKTIVIPYTPEAKEMAAKIEAEANRMKQAGFALVSCAVTPAAKGILVFQKTAEDRAKA